jgi:phosphate acetyltransferase
MLLDHDGVDLDYDECIGVTYDDVRHDPDAALATIVERYKAVEAQCDAVVIVGSDYTDVGSPAELAYNARIAANLGAPCCSCSAALDAGDAARAARLVAPRTPAEMGRSPSSRSPSSRTAGRAVRVVANRADPDSGRASPRSSGRSRRRSGRARAVPVWAIPEDRYLVAPSIRGIMRSVGGDCSAGRSRPLTREALGVVVAGMSMVNVLPRLLESAIVVIPADRSEVLLATLLANASGTFPSLAGDRAERRVRASGAGSTAAGRPRVHVPIITTDLGTYETAVRIMSTRGAWPPIRSARYDTALALFERNVDTES